MSILLLEDFLARRRIMKARNKIIPLFLFLLLPIALLSGCEGHNFDGLIQQTNIHSVGSKAKMSSLLKDAESNSAFRTNGWGVGMEGDVATSEDAESDPRDYVDTNEQVEGVKEGDIVKTDGTEIYYAPRYHNVIRVVTVENNFDVTLERTIDLENTYVDSLYLLEDYLVVVGYTFPEVEDDYDEEYMYYRWWSPTGTVLIIDRSNYEIVYELLIDSYFLDHRIIDNSIFLVSHKYVYYGDVEYEYRPTYSQTRNGITTIEYLDFASIYYFDDTPAYGMNVLTGIKVADSVEDITYTSKGYLGASSYYKNMYVNRTDLYLIETTYVYQENSYYTTSTISQFNLDISSSSSTFIAAVIVLGASLNQFSMDVYDGYLRVATTDRRSSWTIIDSLFGWISETSVSNHLFVLQSDNINQTFNLVGHLSEGLGKPGEDIKSVRFDKETAYVVTFLVTDPLYVIDLSNPALPLIAGEIIQEGFDTYTHVWGEGNLIGIGYDADENGSITGMKISTYKVNVDEEEVIQTFNIYSYDVSGESSWTYGFSEALYNHKSILVSVDKGYLGFAVEAYEYGYANSESGRDWYYRYHSYYYLFKIDFSIENPIQEPVIIEHQVSEDYYLGVDRGVMIEDYLYTFSDLGIITYSLIDEAIIEPPFYFETI